MAITDIASVDSLAANVLREVGFPNLRSELRLIPQNPLDARNVWILDNCQTQTFDHDGDVTRHPVHKGSPLTDHVTDFPAIISVSGFITNHPVVDLWAIVQNIAATLKRPLDLLLGGGRAAQLYEELIEAKRKRTLYNVITSTKEFTSYAIAQVRISRDPEFGEDLAADIVLKHIRIATVGRVPSVPDVDAKLAGAGGTQDVGNRATAEIQLESLLKLVSESNQ